VRADCGNREDSPHFAAAMTDNEGEASAWGALGIVPRERCATRSWPRPCPGLVETNEDIRMNRQISWGMAAVLALCGAGLGCAQSGLTVRGQSPTPASPASQVVTSTTPPADYSYGPIIGSAPGYAEHKKHGKRDFKTYTGFRDNHFGYEGGYYSGPEGYYTDHHSKAYVAGSAAGGCPHCQYGNACPPNGCQQCGHGCPKHHHSYQYKWPENLVYPDPHTPAGMVQWPYYTLRGPSDFFMK
jgi:hypothetical protein